MSRTPLPANPRVHVGHYILLRKDDKLFKTWWLKINTRWRHQQQHRATWCTQMVGDPWSRFTKQFCPNFCSRSAVNDTEGSPATDSWCIRQLLGGNSLQTIIHFCSLILHGTCPWAISTSLSVFPWPPTRGSYTPSGTYSASTSCPARNICHICQAEGRTHNNSIGAGAFISGDEKREIIKSFRIKTKPYTVVELHADGPPQEELDDLQLDEQEWIAETKNPNQTTATLDTHPTLVNRVNTYNSVVCTWSYICLICGHTYA